MSVTGIALLLLATTGSSVGRVEPTLEVVKTTVIPGEPLFAIVGVVNRSKTPYRVALAESASEPGSGHFEWSDARTTWTRCIDTLYSDSTGVGVHPRAEIPSPKPKEKALLQPSQRVIATWMIDLKEACAVTNHRPSVQIRYSVEIEEPTTGHADQVMSRPVEVKVLKSRNGDEAKRYLEGYSHLSRFVPPCFFQKRELDPANYGPVSREMFPRDVETYRAYIKAYPDFPFIGCLRAFVGCALSASKRFAEAKAEFRAVRDTARYEQLRKQANDAIGFVDELSKQYE